VALALLAALFALIDCDGVVKWPIGRADRPSCPWRRPAATVCQFAGSKLVVFVFVVGGGGSGSKGLKKQKETYSQEES